MFDKKWITLVSWGQSTDQQNCPPSQGENTTRRPGASGSFAVTDLLKSGLVEKSARGAVFQR